MSEERFDERVFVEGLKVNKDVVYTVTKNVPTVETKRIPHTVTRNVSEEVVKQIPTTVTRKSDMRG